jgi:GTP pyrophosphokinase
LYGALATGRIDIADLKEPLLRHVAGEDVGAVHRRGTRGRQEEETAVAGAGGGTAGSGQDPGSGSGSGSGELIIDDSIRGLEYKLARCCNPVRGDEVFGFVTVSSGITIHRTACPNAPRLREQYPYRVIAARWRE